jgi:Kef-type K+ transport system membrane component KefB
MPDVDFANLLGVLAIALLAPLAIGFAPRLKVPAVVLEIVLGVAVGPSALGWLEPAAVLLMVAFAVLAERLGLGLESILSAFLAGAAVAALDRDSSSHPHFRTKLDAIGYGFLIPEFFIASGMRLDVSGLVSSADDLARLPVYVAVLLVVRGAPALLYLRRLGRSGAVAAGLLQATSLPFIVATQIGTLTGRMTTQTATGLVCAGLVSVLVFPALATAISAEHRPEDAVAR